MSADMNRAASVTPPVVGKNLWVLAGTASSRSIQIPDEWRGQYLTLHAEGDDFWFSFSLDAGATASATDATGVAGSPLVFGAFGTETERVVSGTKCNVDLSMIRRKPGEDNIYFNVIATGTAGLLRITRSSGFVA
jgi:hypothetical protein